MSSELTIKSTIKLAGIVFLLAVVTSCSQDIKLSEESRNRIEQEIRQSFNGLVDASNALDTERYFEYFELDKFVGLSADGTNWNSIDDLRALIKPSFDMVEKVESLEFTNVHISVIDPNTAVLVNEYEQRILLKSGEIVQDAGGGAQVWSKISGKWKLVSVSASSKPVSK